MSNNWQQTAIISPGGTVFNIANDAASRVWLSTDAGIYFGSDETWSPLTQGQPLSQISALGWADTVLFAGGGQGQIVYSTDSGQHWYQGRLGQTNAPITCFAAAPNFSKTGAALAGTDGAGVLRSTDGGRNWHPANFGLQEFTVLALATAPAWDRREIAFAATAHGFYRSSNGGRAWKKSDTGLEDAAVQSIAVSPNFVKDRTVFVGTETRGIFRSTDSGKTWQARGQGLAPATGGETELPPVNGLWLRPEFGTTPAGVAGTGDGQIFISDDGGANWHRATTAGASVLCLGGTAGELYAGLHDRGLLRSIDGGQTWSQVSGLAARAITRLANGGGQNLFAFGPLEGLWRSTDGGQSWTHLNGLAEHLPLLAVAASPKINITAARGEYAPCLLASTRTGLLYSPDQGQSWEVVLPGKEVVTICFSSQLDQDGLAWAGTGNGQLLASTDGGQSWVDHVAPKIGIPLIALVYLPLAPKVGGDTLTAVTYDLDKQIMTLWRLVDGGWQQWQQVSATWPAAHVEMAGQAAGRVLICMDRRGWCSTATGWERVLETDQPIVRLGCLADGKNLLALTSRQLLWSADGVNWTSGDEGIAGQTLLDVAVSPATDTGQTVSVLTTGGVLWQKQF